MNTIIIDILYLICSLIFDIIIIIFIRFRDFPDRHFQLADDIYGNRIDHCSPDTKCPDEDVCGGSADLAKQRNPTARRATTRCRRSRERGLIVTAAEANGRGPGEFIVRYRIIDGRTRCLRKKSEKKSDRTHKSY